jgi:epoxyqueuosine reductase
MNSIQKLTEAVRLRAKELGFEACGFAAARKLHEEESRLEQWLKESKHGTMTWMENNFDKRLDPSLLVPGAKSVISLIMSYNQPDSFQKIDQSASDKPKISKYALGEDYHHVMKKSMFELFEFTKELNGGLEGRVFVDSAPVMDKSWAKLSGNGWIGKNSNLLNKKLGSYFFIGEMIVDQEFVYDLPTTDHCGTCTLCIEACPTDAIYEPFKVDATKCISYLTIELREAIPLEYQKSLGNWIYGCDICQDVCPWNRKAKSGSNEKLFINPNLLDKDIGFWEELNIEHYKYLFRKSAVKRTKFDGLKRNIAVVSANIKK